MHSIGFEQARERWKTGGKMAYWLYRKRPPTHIHTTTEAPTGSLALRRQRSGPEPEEALNDPESTFRTERGRAGEGRVVPVAFDKKVVLREGKRNNFCILL